MFIAIHKDICLQIWAVCVWALRATHFELHCSFPSVIHAQLLLTASMCMKCCSRLIILCNDKYLKICLPNSTGHQRPQRKSMSCVTILIRVLYVKSEVDPSFSIHTPGLWCYCVCKNLWVLRRMAGANCGVLPH